MTKNQARIAAMKRISGEWTIKLKAAKVTSPVRRRSRSPSPVRRRSRSPSPVRRRSRSPSPVRSSSPKRKASPRRLSEYQLFFKEHYAAYNAAAVARGLTKVDAKKVATQQISEAWADKKKCSAGASAPAPHHRTGEEPDTYAEYLKKYYPRVLAVVRDQEPALTVADASKVAKKRISEQWAAWRVSCRRSQT